MRKLALLGRLAPAFTLIELLVVIAILSILASILFPVFAQAREQARSIACLSNTKQIGTAVLMYGQDYDETVVPWLICKCGGIPGADLDPTYNRVWVSLLQPYLKNGPTQDANGMYQAGGVMKCPSYSDSKLLDAATQPDCDGPNVNFAGGDTYFPPGQLFATYSEAFDHPYEVEASKKGPCLQQPGGGTPRNPCFAYPGSYLAPPDANAVYGDIYPGVPWNDVRALNAVVRPAETVLVGDGATIRSTRNFLFQTFFGCEAAKMHNEGGNFTFLDGHSKHIVHNIKSYLAKSADGVWYQKYLDWAR